MNDSLFSDARKSKSKCLTEEDIPLIKHYFRLVYGWISDSDFAEINLDGDFWKNFELVQEEVRKKEESRLCTLKHQGVKHPK